MKTTCALGLLLLAVMVPCTLAWDEPSPKLAIDSQDDAKAIMDKSIKAYGGVAQLKKWSCGYVKYRSTAEGMGMPGSVVMEETFQFPGRFKRIAVYQLQGRESRSVYVIDKEKSWSKFNDRETQTEPDGNDFGKKTEHPYANFYSLAPVIAGNNTFKRLDDDKAGTQEVAVVRIQGENQVQVDFYFDKKTALLLKTRRYSVDPDSGKKIIADVFLEEHKEVQGVTVPMRIKGYQDGKPAMTMTILELKFKDKYPDGTFAKP